MRKFSLASLLLMMLFAALPASAQEDAGLAGSIPALAPVYLEIKIDEETQAGFQDIARRVVMLNTGNATMAETMSGQMNLDLLVAQMNLGDLSYSENIAPWIGHRIGVGLGFEPTPTLLVRNVVIALPVADAEALTALTDKLTETESQGDYTRYTLEGYPDIHIVTSSEMVWVGTEDGVGAAIETHAGQEESLADFEPFQRVIANLPTDPELLMFVNGEWTAEYFTAESVEGANQFAELVFRTHPAESQAETALLETEWIDGFGVALEVRSDRIDLTTATVLDAEYAAPTLATASAGEGLLPYIPGDAVMFFDSYDVPINLLVVNSLYLGPVIQNIFDNIVTSLENPSAPTPTPQPPPTTDEVLAQVDPLYRQFEILLGVEMSEVFELLSGEYATAVFPGLEGPLMGSETFGLTGAYYLRTDNPERMVEILDAAMNAFQNTSGSVPRARREETLNGANVVIWEDGIQGDALAYGVLAENVFFITVGASAPVVTAALESTPLADAPQWPAGVVNGYGEGQEALIYFDIAAIADLVPAEQGGEQIAAQLAGLDSLTAAVDIAADGVFITRTTLSISE